MLWSDAIALVSTPPSAETKRVVGQLSAVLMVLALTGLIAVCVLAIVAIRRKTRLRLELERRARAPSSSVDAWNEASNRVPLEDDEEIPREPGTA